MSVLAFDFYAEDDPNGTALGTLDDTQCKAMEWRVALHELGAGKFTISRHHTAATSTLIRENNLVKVRIPSVSEDPIFAFWLKEGDFTLIDNREQGGEDLTFGGPGVLYVLSLARLNEEFYAPSQDFRGNSPDIPGMWRWYTEPYGAILTRGIEEGQNQPGEPLEDVTIRVTTGFEDTRLFDSNGDAWPNIEEDFQTPIGTDVLTLAERISVAGDLLLVGEPDLTIGLYQDYGRTLTGSFGASTVRFQKGINILTQLKRQIKARAMLTHLIQRDKDGEYTTEVSPSYSAGDRAHYGFFEAGQTNDAAQLEKMGQNIMASSLTSGEAHELEITPGFDPTNGRYMPGPDGTDGHFWIGDRVTLHTGTGEHDFNAASQIVVAIRVVLDEAADDATDDTAARSLHIVPELNYREVRGFASEGIQPAAIGEPGFCCGPPVCTGTTVGGGEELLNFDWQEAPDNEEIIPAIAGLSQPAITLGSTENPAIIPGDYYYAMHDRDDAVYVFTAVDPGDEIVVSLQYSTGQHWSVRDIEPLVLEWVSGSYTGASSGYTTLSVNELELSYSPNVLRSGAISATAPGSAVGLRLAKDSAGTTLPFFVHALIVTSGGTVIDCPPNSVSPHDHTHDEFHNIHTVEALATAETDDTLVLAPDGTGGVEFRAETGGGIEVAEVDGTPDVSGVTRVEFDGATVVNDGGGQVTVEITGGGVTDHGALTGLTDDDHTQYVKDAEFAAKGDLLGGTGAGTFDNLTVGTNAHSLVADSTQTTGLAWAARLSTGDHAAIDHGGIVGTSEWDATITQASDQDVTDNVTPQNSTDLALTADANSVYEIQFRAVHSQTNSTAKTRWRFQCSQAIPFDGRGAHGWLQDLSSAGAAGGNTVAVIGATGGGTQWPGSDQTADLPSASDALDNMMVVWGEWFLSTGGSSTTVTYQFANATGGAGSTTRLHAGSTVRYRKIAG